MSPSRGGGRHCSRFLVQFWQCRRTYSTTTTTPTSNPHAAPKTPIELLRLSPHQFHIYRSNSNNPYFNLSAEDYLLRHSPAESTILFTYTNSPSIIIGRNQNPWCEINFPLLNTPEFDDVEYVRRRSGGGTVYHDLGNLCWSVIMPRKTFDRDANAHLVVRALKKLGVDNAAVNVRHDIVLKDGKGERKVSGSAYKIIRERSYHHATLLLSSDLERLGKVLKSPLKDYIQAQGVESVRSPVTNIGVDRDRLVEVIEGEFVKSVDEDKVARVTLEEEETLRARQYIQEGMQELESNAWLYAQTPRFTLSFDPLKPLPEIPQLPGVVPMLPQYGKFSLMVNHGKIIHSSITTSPDPDFAYVESTESHARLLDTEFSGSSLYEKISAMKTTHRGIGALFGEWLRRAVGEWDGNPPVEAGESPSLRERATARRKRRNMRSPGRIESAEVVVEEPGTSTVISDK